jgi:hypothetical protein
MPAQSFDECRNARRCGRVAIFKADAKLMLPGFETVMTKPFRSFGRQAGEIINRLCPG